MVYLSKLSVISNRFQTDSSDLFLHYFLKLSLLLYIMNNLFETDNYGVIHRNVMSRSGLNEKSEF